MLHLLAQATQPPQDVTAILTPVFGSIAGICFLTWQLVGWTKSVVVCVVLEGVQKFVSSEFSDVDLFIVFDGLAE